MSINPPTEVFLWPTLAIDGEKLVELTKDMYGVSYGLGYKAVSLGQEPGSFMGVDAHGHQAHKVDCSGFVRYVLDKLTGTAIPDGSVNQREWVEAKGFKHSDFESGKLKDGIVRIAFLRPQDTHEGIGHVCLLLGGETCESHGGTGVDRRAWGSSGWMKNCHVYVLSLKN